jgi:hypothetical protein
MNRPHPIFPTLAPAFSLPLALTALLLAAPAPSSSQTILNTERFQLLEVDGPHLTVSASATGRRGNSEIFVADASGIVGILRGNHWTRLIFGGSYLRDGERSLLDARFAQLRYTWSARERLQTFHFAQAQDNESLRLRRRLLLGSGVQYRVLETERASLTLGAGGMVEWERIAPDAVNPGEPTEGNAVRMANLGVFRYRTQSGTNILNVTYFQPRFDALGDQRILNDLGVTFPVTERVRLTMSGEWRRDTRPPPSLKRDDLVLRMGVSLDFR